MGSSPYFALGAVLYGSVKALGSQGTYRRSRHVLAFAAVPIALSLVIWPVKLALYGGDWFRAGGRDTGAGAAVFDLIEFAFFAWAAVHARDRRARGARLGRGRVPRPRARSRSFAPVALALLLSSL